MEIIKKNLRIIGIILLIILPTFQFIDSRIKSHSDYGVEIYGDNFLREIIGVKSVFYNQSGNWADQLGVELITPKWMRKVGVSPNIYWGWKTESNFFGYGNSSLLQILSVTILRWIIKLIPLYIFLLGVYLEKKGIKHEEF